MAKKIKDADFTNLTKTRMKKAATRTNRTQPIAHLEYQSMKGPIEVRGTKPWAPRIRQENEATGPVDDLWQRPTYRTGDGDIATPMRPGSLDYKNWPSRGF